MARGQPSPQPGRIGPVRHTHGSYGVSDTSSGPASRRPQSSEVHGRGPTNHRDREIGGDRVSPRQWPYPVASTSSPITEHEDPSSQHDYRSPDSTAVQEEHLGTPTSGTTEYVGRQRAFSGSELESTASSQSRLQGVRGKRTNITGKVTRRAQGGRTITSILETVEERFAPSQETLAGISGQVYDKDGDVEFRDVDLVQSDGPTTASSSDWLIKTVPWSQQDLRSADNQEAAQLAVAETIFRDGEHSVQRKGGRKGPLSKGGREAAAAVRDNGACLRCFIMKEQCDTQSECARCLALKKSVRCFNLGCVRVRLKDRWRRLMPEALTSHLTPEEFQSFIRANAEQWVGDVFLLPLTQDFGRPIYVEVREVNPMGTALINKDIFGTEQGPDVRVSRSQIASLPLVPYVVNFQFAVDHVREKIGYWLHLVSESDDADWHEVCFHPAKLNETWQRNVLDLVGQYHHQILKTSDELLKLSMKMSFVNYLIGHIFTIPNDAVPEVFAKIKNKEYLPAEQPEWVCPRAVDRWLKRILLPLLRAFEKQVLEGLEETYLRKPASGVTRDLAFCVTFIVMVVAGTTQTAILEKAIAARRAKDLSISLDIAQEEIRNIEKDIIDHLLGFWHYSFRLKKKLKGNPAETHSPEIAERAEKFDLLEKFRISVDCIESNMNPGRLDLDEIDEEKFSAVNVTRILTKLYTCVFQVEPWKRFENPPTSTPSTIS